MKYVYVLIRVVGCYECPGEEFESVFRSAEVAKAVVDQADKAHYNRRRAEYTKRHVAKRLDRVKPVFDFPDYVAPQWYPDDNEHAWHNSEWIVKRIELR